VFFQDIAQPHRLQIRPAEMDSVPAISIHDADPDGSGDARSAALCRSPPQPCGPASRTLSGTVLADGVLEFRHVPRKEQRAVSDVASNGKFADRVVIMFAGTLSASCIIEVRSPHQ
jgi:hypothetical protein